MSGGAPGLAVPYTATQKDLFYPAKDLTAFPTVLPATDAELWACDGDCGRVVKIEMRNSKIETRDSILSPRPASEGGRYTRKSRLEARGTKWPYGVTW